MSISNANDDHDRLVETATQIVDWVTPVVLLLQDWNLSHSRNTLTRIHGIGLETRERVM
jgi:hypothetical protein